ncbi:MAG: DUF1302 domain-containing protein [Gammaproteobacteria bacterium]|nr:DUF1302 domain-containing protein [Gammaproteobacteria bacterium]
MARVQTAPPGVLLLLVAATAAFAVLAPALALGGESATTAYGPAGPVQEAPADAPAPSEALPSEFKWNWDNTVSYGLGFRLNDPDRRLIGLAAGGTAYSVNGDDGIQNYDTGIFTNAAKLTSELEWSYRGIGGFVRAFGFYDYENQSADRVRTELSSGAKRRVGARAELRDAFVYGRFKLGGRPGELRAGWQVINWGESTFIQGGISAINPVDVSALRVPGSELREAFLPLGAVKLSLKPSTSTSFEAFYQFTWEQTYPDPVGSYFSTTDLAGEGATKVMLGFGSAPDTIPVGTPIPGNPVGVAVPRVDTVEPSSQGQYGAALRVLLDGLGGTELSAYFVNYHSRLPLIMANTGTAAGLLQSGNYAASASYFLTYPEDIKLLGFGFNTQLGRSGIALQGELSHRLDVPLQMDDVEILYAALTPLRLLPPVPQLAPLIGLGNLLAANNQVGAYGFSQPITGYRRFDTTQAQITLTKAFSRLLGADQVVLVGEAGWSTVHDMPAQSELRLEAPGTYTSGNEVFTTARVQPATEPASAFPTKNSWGYVVAGRFEYNNAIGAVNMTPRFSFSQDVSGISPGPGGNFVEGRKGLTLGLALQYRFNWELDVSYTNFFGADRYNLLNDRDFVAANVKFSF